MIHKISTMLFCLSLLNSAIMFGQGSRIASFEHSRVDLGRWHQLGNCRVEMNKNNADDGQGCLHVVFGENKQPEYAAIGFTGLSAVGWQAVDRINFRVKGDGTNNFVRLSIITDKNNVRKVWTWNGTIFSADGGIRTDKLQWQSYHALLKDFVGARNPDEHLQNVDASTISYIMFGLESAGQIQFPINKPFSFWLDEVTVETPKGLVKPQEQKSNKPSLQVNFPAAPPDAFPNHLTMADDGSRYEQLINGDWKFAPYMLDQEISREKITWSKYAIKVPSMWYHDEFGFPHEWKMCQKAWYGKTINIPEKLSGKVFKLDFRGVMFYCEIYVNGIKMGNHVGGMSPFTVDITSALKFGADNEIEIFVQDKSYAIKAPLDELKTLPARGMWNGIPSGAMIAPVNTSGGAAGIWQDVWLRAFDPVYVNDVFVITSVKDKSITLELDIDNQSGKDRKLKLNNTIYPALKREKINWYDYSGTVVGNQSALNFAEKEIELKQGSNRVTVTMQWSNPRLWSPESPSLYYVKTRIGDDVRLTRFGFREISIFGKNILLNGNIHRFRGDCPFLVFRTAAHLNRQFMTACFRNYKEHNANFIHTLPDNMVGIMGEVADELGICLIPHFNIMQRMNLYLATGEEFWKNTRNIFREMVSAVRNHPSVIMYGIEDEVYLVFGPASSAFLVELANCVRKYDKTRPLIYSGDGEAGGASEIFCESYGFSRNIEPYASGYKNWVKTGDMPVFSYYFFQDYLYGQIGDRIYDWENARKLYAGCNKQTSERLRMGGVSAIIRFGQADFAMGAVFDEREITFNYGSFNTPFPKPMKISPNAASRIYTNPGWDPHTPLYIDTPSSTVLKHAYAPLFTGIRHQAHNYYSGEKISSIITVCNDTSSPRKITLTWFWREADTEHKLGSRKIDLHIGQILDCPIEFTVPETTHTRHGELLAKISEDEHIIHHNQMNITVFPRSRQTNTALQIALYDVSGKTAELLNKLKIPFVKIDDIAKVGEDKLLVIGFGSSDDKLNQQRETLKTFVGNGGKILCLKQNGPIRWAPHPIAFSFVPTVECRTPHLRFVPPSGKERSLNAIIDAPGHPIFTGLPETEIYDWRGLDHRVADDLFYRPGKFYVPGNYRVLMASGIDAKAVILEQFHGNGTVLFCQLRLDANLGLDPEADLLFANMLAYLKNARPPTRKLYFTGNENIREKLKNDGAEFASPTLDESTACNKDSIIFIHGAVPQWITAERLDDWMKNGCTVIFNELPANSQIYGVKAIALPETLTFAVPAITRKADSPASLIWGIRSNDINEESGRVFSCGLECNNPVAQTLLYAGGKKVEAHINWGLHDRASERAFSAARTKPIMLSIRKGTGSLIFSQLKLWKDTSAMNYTRHTLLTNTGLPLQTATALISNRKTITETTSEDVYKAIKAGEVAIDGRLNEWTYENVLRSEVNNFRHANPIVINATMNNPQAIGTRKITSNRDCSAIAYLMHDDKNLYFGIHVIDNQYLWSDTTPGCYNFDSVELWLDELQLVFARAKNGGNLLFSIKGDKGCFHNQGSMKTSITPLLGNVTDMELLNESGGSVNAAPGYVMEIAIPLDMLQLAGINIHNGKTHRLAVCINDRDSHNEVDASKLCWPVTWKWGNPKTFNPVIFTD